MIEGFRNRKLYTWSKYEIEIKNQSTSRSDINYKETNNTIFEI